MTIEVEEKDRKMRAFATYKLELRDREQAIQKLNQMSEEMNYKKYEMEVHFQAKQLDLFTAHRIKIDSEGTKTQLGFTYPESSEQAGF